MHILVTGGAGYIGSHTAVELLNNDYEVTIVDNFANSKPESLKRVQEITGKSLNFHQVDILDTAGLDAVFAQHSFDAVIHFAAFKAVGESVEKPLDYYRNNISGTVNLCRVMQKHGVKNFVFSSSCTVYGEPETVPITEDFPTQAAASPYGSTKLMAETILQDVFAADNSWNIALLRYFNPLGAHESGRIGEDPNGIPNNLVPYIAQVAIGKRPFLRVWGNDYPTPDGTGVRDYIHVTDLAQGHLRALEKLMTKPGVVIYNLGTGNGYSVLEVLAAFEEACGHDIPYELSERRPGDVVSAYANPSKAEKELGWKAKRNIYEMCVDTWRWQQQNPNGYEE